MASCQTQPRDNTKEDLTVTAVPPSLVEGKNQQSLIYLDDREAEELNIRSFKVKKEIHSYTLDVPGVVFASPNHKSIISTPLAGRVVVMGIREGDHVNRGDILFKIESLDLGVLVSEYIQAVAEEEYYQTRYNRIKQLAEKQISAASELDKASSDLKRVVTIAKGAYSKLRAAGIPDNEIRQFLHQENIEPVLNLRSPINGICDQRNVDLGQRVSAYESLGTVIDNAYIMIRGYLSPEDGALVKPGDVVQISRRVEEQHAMISSISTVNPGLDETNRSAIVNIFMHISGDWPRPGENIRLKISISTPEALIAIPLRAVTYNGNDPIVFVRKEPKVWEQRVISIREFRDTSAIVTNGLAAGEEVAISQIFSLKALSRYEQLAEE